MAVFSRLAAPPPDKASNAQQPPKGLNIVTAIYLSRIDRYKSCRL